MAYTKRTLGATIAPVTQTGDLIGEIAMKTAIPVQPKPTETSVWTRFLKGASDLYSEQRKEQLRQQQAALQVPMYAPTFMERHGTMVVLGAAGVTAALLLRKKR